MEGRGVSQDGLAENQSSIPAAVTQSNASSVRHTFPDAQISHGWTRISEEVVVIGPPGRSCACGLRLAQGLAEGLAKGLAKGLAQGLAKGLGQGPAGALGQALAQELTQGLGQALAQGLGQAPKCWPKGWP